MTPKPCPFCGSYELEYQIGTTDKEGIPTNIVCTKCGCTGPQVYLSEKELACKEDELPERALQEWNSRSPHNYWPS